MRSMLGWIRSGQIELKLADHLSRPTDGLLQAVQGSKKIYSILDSRKGVGKWDPKIAALLVNLGIDCCADVPSKR